MLHTDFLTYPNMKVLKFGGTSVGTPESLLCVKRIVETAETPIIVVVSALGGVTDQLIRLSQEAQTGDVAYVAQLAALHQRHKEMVQALITPDRQTELLGRVQAHFDELGSILHGVSLIQDLTRKTADAIVAYGERISSLIVAALIDGARHLDSRDLIITVQQEGKNVVDFETTNAHIRNAFATLPAVTVMGGFISRDGETQRTTNLGRGGSDYTAAILAAALEAEVLEIWTDVDGFMTADPRVIPTAFTIDELSYAEATELCNFGAKVVYPPTIYPVCAKEIPILIRNTFNPVGKQSIIKKEAAKSDRLIRGISSVNDTALVTVSGMAMVGVVGVNHRIFSALAKEGVSVFMVAQTASETSTSLCVTPNDVERAAQLLDEEFAQEIAAGAMNPAEWRVGLATVAVVGENLRQHTGTVGKLFSVLGRNGIGVCAVALGALETSVSFVVARDQLKKALNVLHDSFFLADYEELNLFLCGTGTVGGQLLEQLAAQADHLREQHGLKINLVGLTGQRHALYDAEGIDLANCRTQLTASATPGGVERMMDEIIKMNIFNSVFVDCTASADVSAHYERLLAQNVNIVTANKLAASGEYDTYRRLKVMARDRGVKFHFETNVGAGLPIINTINDLTASGDRVLSIEAVLSGTLNYVFSTLSSDVPLSQAVRLAQENGYSEPDPRIDLCGMDVVRKLTILARESGYRVDTTDIEQQLFLPEAMFEGSLDEFWAQLPNFDADFEARRSRLAAEGKCWRFVAEWRNGKGRVGLKEIVQGHPLYNLEGSNNIVCLTTERYDAPMLIQGYGAGAEVTAAGVFADIMRVANI